MKSIQSKIILLILIGTVVSATIIGGVGIFSFQYAIDKDMVKIMNLTCSEKAQELNNVFARIERSVEIMSVYAIDNLESAERLSNDTAYFSEYTQLIKELGLMVANETDGAVGVYIRFNPDITYSTAGFFMVKDSQSGSFEDFEITDFNMYSPDDIPHVGWYYVPVSKGSAVWMQPYYNENTGANLISYVIPIYKYNELVGIVGMDIDFTYVIEKTDSIKICETGYAFLADENFKIVHSRNNENGALVSELSESLAHVEDDVITGTNSLYDYTWNGVKKRAAFRTLQNGMCLAVTAPVSEIDKTKNTLIFHIIIMTIVIAVVFIVVAVRIAKTIIKPLKELNIAAKEIAAGNLDISPVCKSKDEVGTLAESLRETANQLKIRINYINNLAYIDKLTGIKNNTAYMHEVSVIKENMQNSGNVFSVFVIDINGLKVINDTYGHDCGNKFIIGASHIIADIFGNENVYRIGGDEFTVILKNAGDKECAEYEQKFAMALNSDIGEMKLSAAIGSAVYDKMTDNSYESVFRRADEKMYKRKLEMKSHGETSIIENKQLI